MKLLCYLLSVAVSSAYIPREYYPWRRTQLSAVTHFRGFEQFYLRKMRLQKPKSVQAERDYPEDTIEVKKTLCNKILSNHEQMTNEFLLNFDIGSVRHALKEDDENLYKEIFMYDKVPVHDDESSSDGMCFPFGATIKRRYVNPYVEINAVVDGEIVTENVFKCLARRNGTRDIIQYYVSEEYNVNIRRTKINNIEPQYITGRFVFSQDRNEVWKLLEMAEEGAILTPSSLMNSYEKIYLKYRKSHKIADDPEEDPICKLDEPQILRLCVSMMNTSEMTGRGKFPQFVQKYHNLKPETQKATLPCVKREVKFSTKLNFLYEEWTVSCHVETRHGTKETFIVSRGYKMNSIFVFDLLKDGQIKVKHHSYNVSVVDDPTPTETQHRNVSRIRY